MFIESCFYRYCTLDAQQLLGIETISQSIIAKYPEVAVVGMITIQSFGLSKDLDLVPGASERMLTIRLYVLLDIFIVKYSVMFIESCFYRYLLSLSEDLDLVPGVFVPFGCSRFIT
jgi:hypothetical protein